MLNYKSGNSDRLVFFGCLLCAIVLAGVHLMH